MKRLKPHLKELNKKEEFFNIYQEIYPHRFLKLCETEHLLHRGNLGVSKSGLNLLGGVLTGTVGRLRALEALILDLSADSSNKKRNPCGFLFST